MNPWSFRCSKLALGKTNKVSVFLANTYSGCPWSGKSQREITFFKAKELSGIFDISQGIFQFKPKSGNFEKQVYKMPNYNEHKHSSTCCLSL